MARILFLMMFPFMCFSQITPREDIPVNNILKEKENLDTKRKASYNLDEIKVRWKKAALENCNGAPCSAITAPGAPTGVVATAGNASASVAFTAPASNGGSVITGYTVTSSPGGISATGASATSPIIVTGLTNGTSYTFTVVATNAIGNSVASTASTAVTPVIPITAPGAPTNVVATAGNASASVAFTAPASNGGSVITGYTVTSSPGGISAMGASATSPIIVTGLTNGTSYTFTVVATNAIGNSEASTLSTAVTPAPTRPDAPENAFATVLSANSVSVAFTVPASDGGSVITDYLVKYSFSGGVGQTALRPATTLTLPIIGVTGLISGTTYTFYVVALNGVGYSNDSLPSNVVTTN